MANLEMRPWEADPAGPTRRDRRRCDYEVYIPDPLGGRRFGLDGDVAAAVASAEMALGSLNSAVQALANTEALARLLLRAESVASSRIEGLEIGGRRLLHAALARQLGEETRDVTAAEVLGNIDAMVWGVDAVDEHRPLTVETLLEVHRRLLAGTRLDRYAGKLRTVQNWIGGSGHNPCSATFVPPPPELVPALLEDLCAFCNGDSLPALAQAAIAHAQFETIHPFVDGNGRAGRALLHLVLRRRGLARHFLPPVSLILATWSQDYVSGLTATRYVGAPDSSDAHIALNAWISFFSVACERAVEDAQRFEAQVRSIQEDWHARLGRMRSDSAARLLIDVLPGAPVLTASTGAELIRRSFQATSNGIDRLVEAGILSQINVGRRNRAFEAAELIEAFSALERQLASPEGDTRVSSPARRVPRRI